MSLVAHENTTKGWERTQLLKAYDEVRMPYFVATRIQHPQGPTPPPLKNWYLSSLATCWVLPRGDHSLFYFAYTCKNYFFFIKNVWEQYNKNQYLIERFSIVHGKAPIFLFYAKCFLVTCNPILNKVPKFKWIS
jgi:hypothetical protein